MVALWYDVQKYLKEMQILFSTVQYGEILISYQGGMMD